MDQDIFDKMFQLASAARKNSYAPISHFNVGSAIMTADGDFYRGTNLEDPAFNGSVHAEQSCLATMVSDTGAQEVTKVLVVGGNEDDKIPCVPCGHCRQLLAEFAKDTAEIVVVGPQGDVRLQTTLGELLPQAFRLSEFKS